MRSLWFLSTMKEGGYCLPLALGAGLCYTNVILVFEQI